MISKRGNPIRIYGNEPTPRRRNLIYISTVLFMSCIFASCNDAKGTYSNSIVLDNGTIYASINELHSDNSIYTVAYKTDKSVGPTAKSLTLFSMLTEMCINKKYRYLAIVNQSNSSNDMIEVDVIFAQSTNKVVIPPQYNAVKNMMPFFDTQIYADMKKQAVQFKKDNADIEAFVKAASIGDIHAVSNLLTKVDIDGVATAGWGGACSALMRAAADGHIEVVKYLHAKGANINKIDFDGFTALILAAERGRYDVVMYLLDNGADLKVKEKANGSTAFIRASSNGHVKVMHLLLWRGAIINEQNNDGWTALAMAAMHCQTYAVKYLLQKGADANVRDIRNRTAMDHAKEKMCSDTILALQASIDKK